MAYPAYLNLKIGAAGRMASLKVAAIKLNSGHNLRKSQGDESPYTWRDVRYSGFHNAAANCITLTPGFNTDSSGRKTPIYYTHCGQQFPRECYADEILGNHGRPLIDHVGWFTDTDCRYTARGLVVRLPHGRFLAGYEWSDNGERVYYAELYDCERDAMYAADGYAERFAEREREHDVKCETAATIQETIEADTARLRECLALRNNPCFAKLRSEAADIIERIREMRETLRTEYADVL